jgi:hypothetical protein
MKPSATWVTLAFFLYGIGCLAAIASLAMDGRWEAWLLFPPLFGTYFELGSGLGLIARYFSTRTGRRTP